MTEDLASWLRAHSTFDPAAGRFDWDWEAESRALDPRRFAIALRRFAATAGGKPAAFALEAITDVVGWVSELRGDVHAQPRVAATAAWLESFTDAVLDDPTFVRGCALAYVPQLPLGEQHYVDTKVDALLRGLGSRVVTDPGSLAEDVACALEDRSDVAAEKIWWAVLGGTIGTASRLVRYAEIASFDPDDRRRRPAVVALRAALVDATTEPLVTDRLPFWARVWLLESIARVDRRLLEELAALEQMPWLADHMRYQLGLSADDRRARWNTWVVSP